MAAGALPILTAKAAKNAKNAGLGRKSLSTDGKQKQQTETGETSLSVLFDSPVIYGVRVETSKPYYLLISKKRYELLTLSAYQQTRKKSSWGFVHSLQFETTRIGKKNNKDLKKRPQQKRRPSSLISAMRARDSTRRPSARSFSPPPWKTFSMAMPAPTTAAPACSHRDYSPTSAAPVARKSSTISTRSPGPR